MATVAPAILANSVGVNKYVPLPGGTGDAQTGATVVRDPSNGTITFDVGGKAGTNPSMPNGDLKLEAMVGGTVLGTDLVIVQVPTAIGSSHPGVGPTATRNEDLSAATSPAYWGPLPAGNVILATVSRATQSVPVVDQFGNPLGAEYDGHDVYEKSGGQFRDINQGLQSGSYNDPVGFVAYGNLNGVPANSGAAAAWPGSAQSYHVPSPQSVTQNISVQVAGFTLSPGVANRVVSDNNGTITVVWP